MNNTYSAQGSSYVSTWREWIEITKPGILRSNLIALFGGFWLALSETGSSFNYLLFIWTIIGTSLIMASSCVFNNFYDRNLDQLMKRTQNRALPTGRFQPNVALGYAAILGILGFVILSLSTNLLTVACAAIGMFVYVFVYTMWLKRNSTWSTSVGAISGAMPPVIGFTAVTNDIGIGAILLFSLLFFWQPPHFWALSIRRLDEYRNAGYPLLPVIKGIRRTQWQMLPYIIGLLATSYAFYHFQCAGKVFFMTSSLMGLVWLGLNIAGFFTTDTKKWATRNFIFSINYLTINFLILVLDT